MVLNLTNMSAPPPYSRDMIVKPSTVKNSFGGDDPDNSSLTMGAIRNKVRAGGICSLSLIHLTLFLG